MVDHLDPVADGLAADLHEFSLCIQTVITHGNDHRNFRIRHSDLIEVIDQEAEGTRIFLPETGDVAHSDGDRVVWFDDLFQGRRINGVIEGLKISAAQIRQGWTVVPGNFVKELFFRDLELHGPFPKRREKFFIPMTELPFNL